MSQNSSKTYLAADLGAGSGRVMAGHYDGETLSLAEISRFSNKPVEIRGGSYWNIVTLFDNIRSGFAQALAGHDVVSAGIDTWGVDFGLLDANGHLMGMPHAYRDPRTQGMIEKAAEIVPPAELYARTGIQTAFFNTLYQLLGAKNQGEQSLEAASRLLFVPDLLAYWFTGNPVVERTIASTSQLYDPTSKGWAMDFIKRLGIPERLFGEIVPPGSLLGKGTVDGKDLKLVAVGAHDTASAVAAVPMAGADSAYLSSGTWSLLGVELPSPVLTEDARRANFTNETGVGDTIRFLKNITGLWLMQECRASWETKEGSAVSYDALTDQATAAAPFAAFLDPDAPDFVAPGKMPSRIQAYIEKRGGKAPQGEGAITRLIMESLALKYRYVMQDLERLSGRKIEALNVVGGGCRDQLLNQFAANSLGMPVTTGPVEATATGNIIVQMIADGELSGLAQGRELVRRSFHTQTYEPRERAQWEDAYGKYVSFLESGA